MPKAERPFGLDAGESRARPDSLGRRTATLAHTKTGPSVRALSRSACELLATMSPTNVLVFTASRAMTAIEQGTKATRGCSTPIEPENRNAQATMDRLHLVDALFAIPKDYKSTPESDRSQAIAVLGSIVNLIRAIVPESAKRVAIPLEQNAQGWLRKTPL